MLWHSASRAYQLRDILALDGAEFLGQAYLLMLGRPIDPQGFRNYDSQLRAGTAKISILAELHWSQEGQAFGASVPDLLPLLAATGTANSAGVSVQGIRELLALDDVAFVDSAYRTLLGRAPDTVGFSHYLRLIRMGACKMRVVSRLYFSAEGRRRVRSLPGLKSALISYWLARSPLTGWWYRAIARIEGETPLECRLRAIESMLNRMARDGERETLALDASVDEVSRLFKALAQRRSD
jgi:hypothetical protein